MCQLCPLFTTNAPLSQRPIPLQVRKQSVANLHSLVLLNADITKPKEEGIILLREDKKFRIYVEIQSHMMGMATAICILDLVEHTVICVLCSVNKQKLDFSQTEMWKLSITILMNWSKVLKRKNDYNEQLVLKRKGDYNK